MPKLLGHEAIADDFMKLAKRGELSHGYLFYGPSMVGKRTTAQSLARFLEKGMPEGEFAPPAPNEILQDAKVVDLASEKLRDPDRKDSISIEAVREIKNFLWQKPNASAKRTLVVDEAEFLTTEAQNALLKVTEEPPASSLLIVVASDLDGLLATITSRLQRVYFGAVPEAEIARWLAAEHGIAKTKAASLAKQATGKPGLALRLLNDAAFKRNLELAAAFLKTAAAARRDFVKKLIEPDDFNLRVFLEAVIVTLAWEKPSRAKAALWHKALALYGNVMNFGLHPRLQLLDLLL